MASIRKRGKQWAVIYRDPKQHKQVWETCGTRRELAEKRRREVETLLAEGRSPRAQSVTFSETWLKWMELKTLEPSTRADYESMYRVHFQPILGDILLREFNADTVDDFVVNRRTHGINKHGKPEGVSDGRLSRLLITLKAFLNWADSRGYIAHTLRSEWFPNIKMRKKAVTPLTFEQVQQLIEYTDAHYQPFVAFLAYTGARLGEARAVQWNDFEPDFSEVWIRRAWSGNTVKNYTKTGGDRHTPIPPNLANVLSELHDSQGNPDTGWVFVQPSGRPIDPDNFRSRVFKLSLARARLDEGYRVHDLRHGAASLLHRSGVMPRDIMRVLGWKQMGTAMRYMHSTEENESIAEKMQRAMTSETRPNTSTSPENETPVT